MNADIPVHLRGPAGTGKTTMAMQLAARLGRPLERVLDKGIVVAGDVTISLVGIDLLNIKIRLIVATVDRALELGINWWEADPRLTTRTSELSVENEELKKRLVLLEEGRHAFRGRGPAAKGRAADIAGIRGRQLRRRQHGDRPNRRFCRRVAFIASRDIASRGIGVSSSSARSV